MGYKSLIESCNGDLQSAASLLMIEKLSEFVAGFIKSLPQLHEIAAMAGLELPGFLGKNSPLTGLTCG